MTVILAALFLRVVVLGMMYRIAHSLWQVCTALSSLSGGGVVSALGAFHGLSRAAPLWS